jgi:DNA-binding NarL/FixJ family response regulator
MFELGKNPAKILGTGLAANVAGVFIGGLIGLIITQSTMPSYNPTLLALGIVCITLVLLPPLHKKLIELLKSHAYLGTLSEMSPEKQTNMIIDLNLPENFTESEYKVMHLLIKGMTYKTIAGKLNVTENTVKSHVKNIYSKAGVSSKTELANLMLASSN